LNKIKILITGANGQLGQSLQKIPQSKNFDLVATDIHELDITQANSIESFFYKNSIDYCINTAAYTAVDLAEKEKEKATQLNKIAVKNLALNCERFKVHFFHISTDFVFDGQKATPYTETDAVNPLGIYGATKLAGELAALEKCSATTILRTSWLYSPYGKNFVKTMLRLASERDNLGVVSDQVGTPTYAHDLAAIIFKLIELEHTPAGIFHFSNQGVASWYDFAHAIFELTNTKVELSPIFTRNFPTLAQRPAFSVLDKSKITKAFHGQNIRHWREALKDYLEVL